MLEWNDLRLLQALEVAPEYDDDGCAEVYRVKRGGLRLAVAVWPQYDMLHLSLCMDADGSAITSFFVRIVGGIEYVSDRRGQFLECFGCVVSPDLPGDDVGDVPVELWLTLRLFVKPHIEIRFV